MISNLKKFNVNKPNFNPALIRLLYMVAFGIIAYILIWPLLALSVIQFGFQLFEGIPNSRLVNLSNQIIVYIVQIFDYITYQTDQKPYPFSSLPIKTDKKTKTKSKK
ncbi:MAG: hypothetical protein CFH33_00911 [Alphaproteobacteria bacterium MarineAlpha9_Bin3]|nr:MAG: hypothetical protein CFH33_00911 [Alphaproteobacteria bacterium MarineAlpha9_Bin3]|tara:strand:+ start:1127 stop:1447 length:321 start_codon:yes stop_codon:yes gene_type:complete